MALPPAKHLLVIGYVWPEPQSSAAGSHMMSLLTLFKRHGWDVTFASPAQQTAHQLDLDTYGITSVAIKLNCSSFDKFVKALNPQAVLFDRFMMEEQFGWRVAEQCPQALRILDTEDLHSLRDARQKAMNAQREVNDSDLVSDKALREIAAIYRCDLTLVISDYELSLLKKHYKVPAQLLWHLPFLLDTNFDEQNIASFDERTNFVFIGNFRHAPNWDAVQWLRREIWPLIRKQLPNAELHIYGAYPPPKATALNSPKMGFLIKGWAEDAYQVLGEARVCLAPLRFGAGIKGKLTDAMQTGTPSITTSIGIEGIAALDIWPGVALPSLSAQPIADAAVALYQNTQQWESAQQQGFNILQRKFDGERLGTALYAHICHLIDTLEQHRLTNFTGAMLNHHAHRSTKFMAQWIEAKNQLSEQDQQTSNGNQSL